ncbi:MAG: ABC transporter ATP-binding protein [Clostridia bacterium]|nr:ABC transporter ATP-binding protein [Clostridia bacterium]
MLEVTDLCVNYGGIKALKGISFSVEEGQICTLIGANGAGKSTALRAISGLVPVKSGSIRFKDQEIAGLDTQRVVERGVVLVPEGRRVFDNLTVLENLKIGAYLRKDSAGIARDIEYVYSLFPRLKERHWQSAGTLSGGEQQMLAVGRAMMAKPKLLMMDEPSLGLAPLIVKGIFEIITRLSRESGTTILLIEQNAAAALKAADYGYVIETGEIKIEGEGEQLLNDPRVQEAYLGKEK